MTLSAAPRAGAPIFGDTTSVEADFSCEVTRYASEACSAHYVCRATAAPAQIQLVWFAYAEVCGAR